MQRATKPKAAEPPADLDAGKRAPQAPKPLDVVPLPRVRLGDRWWERDSIESAATATCSEGLGWYAVYIFLYVCCAVALLVAAPSACIATPASYLPVASVPPIALLSFRAGFAVFVAFVTVRRTFIECDTEEETLEPRRKIATISHGWWRLCGLTQWQFMTIGVYFALALRVQHGAMSAGRDAAWLHAPSALACVTSTVLGVAFSLAFLTTTVVTFVLVPSKIKNGVSARNFFFFDELVMHNANSFVLVVDLLLSNQRIQLTDLPYTVMFMVVYGVFHHYVRYPRTRTLLYFFLSWKFGKAPLILLALLATVASFFLVGVAVSEVRGEPYGPPLVLLGSVLVMRLREPKVAAK